MTVLYVFCLVGYMHMHHVEHSLCNLNCARVKVHFATRCHAETPSRAAQGSGGNGL